MACSTVASAKVNDPIGSRTRVSGVRGQRPRPLDDGAIYYAVLHFAKQRVN